MASCSLAVSLRGARRWSYEEGAPVPSFTITASPLVEAESGPAAQSFEDEDGRFRLGPLAPTSVRIWAVAPGYQPASEDGLAVSTGKTVEGIVLKLASSAEVFGRVTDARSGHAVEGALIIPAEWRAQALAEAVGAYTDEEGRYRLTALPGKRTSISVTAEGYRPALVGGVEAESGKPTVRNFTLSPQAPDQASGSEVTGVGAVLRQSRGAVEIVELIEGGPAAEVLQAGDLVVMVGDVNARDAEFPAVAQAIRGEAGTPVVLWVVRGGDPEPQRIVIERRRVVVPDRR